MNSRELDESSKQLAEGSAGRGQPARLRPEVLIYDRVNTPVRSQHFSTGRPSPAFRLSAAQYSEL